MIAIAGVLLYLAIARDYEPLLLLPIAAGAILANLPLSPMIGEGGLLSILYDAGVGNELFPLLIFIGIGALTDFGPLLENPRMILLGAAGQFGIFGVLLLALLLGFTRAESASIGIIGAIDGPTSIYVSGLLAPHLLGPITVAAYSYMALVPVIMPPVMRALTTPEERRIRMHPGGRAVSRRTRILFPIAVTLIVGTLVPYATPLVGSLMLGNLMRESHAVERLTGSASNELTNIVTLFLGLAIGSTMVGTTFLQPGTLAILVLGILAFGLDTARRDPVRQGPQPAVRRDVQPAHRRGRDQRLPDGRPGRPAGGPAGGLRELPADARDGRERGRPGREHRRRRRAARAGRGRRPLAADPLRLRSGRPARLGRRGPTRRTPPTGTRPR